MTDNASPDPPDLAGFFQDWTNLWREEMQAQAGDPEAMDVWRAAMTLWANTMSATPAVWRDPRSRTGASTGIPTRPQAGAAPAAAAPDARDAEIDRLSRRVDELEARLAGLETHRRRRS